jgi:hypothetical protein
MPPRPNYGQRLRTRAHGCAPLTLDLLNEPQTEAMLNYCEEHLGEA